MKLINPQGGGGSGGNSDGTLLTSVQTRTQGSYTATYNATDGSGTDPALTPLTMTATASAGATSLDIEWQWSGSAQYDGSLGFIVKKDGAIMTDSTDGINGWSCLVSVLDNDNGAYTTSAITIKIRDNSPSSGVAKAYTLCARATAGTTNVMYLNRPVNTPTAGISPTMSSGTIKENY